jgi:hypothetical protein
MYKKSRLPRTFLSLLKNMAHRPEAREAHNRSRLGIAGQHHARPPLREREANQRQADESS